MIGMFDSGSGGLTVLRALKDVLPSSDVLYFGDIKHAPYGSRSREELFHLTMRAIKLLQDNGAQSIISACNSVSASLAISLFDTLSVSPQHVLEMVGPTVGYFRDSNERLLLVATPATIASDIYQSAFRMIGKHVDCVAIEGLAGAIEEGASHERIENLIREALSRNDLRAYDTVILACTHYPLAHQVFKKVFGTTNVFDPAQCVAARAEMRLWPREAGEGTLAFLLSQDSEVFRRFVSQLFPDSTYSIKVLDSI